MKNTPAVSVIVANYNNAKYLHDALNSVRAQTMSDWECIVVDDGSTDNSRAIINEFVQQDSRFRKIFKQNGGVSTARNAGLDTARGEYIMFLDSDDCYLPYAMELLYNLAICTMADRVGGRLIPVPHDFKYMPIGAGAYEVTGIDICTNPPNDLVHKYFTNNDFPWVTVWRQMFRHEKIRQLRFPTDTLNAFEDELFMADVIANISRFAETDNPIVFFRLSPNSLCRGGDNTNRLIMQSAHNALVHALDALEHATDASRTMYMHAYLFTIKYITDMGIVDVFKNKKIRLYRLAQKTFTDLYNTKLMPRKYVPKYKRIAIHMVQRNKFMAAHAIIKYAPGWLILNWVTCGMIRPVRRRIHRKI